MKLDNNIGLSGVSHLSACVGELQDHTCLGLVCTGRAKKVTL